MNDERKEFEAWIFRDVPNENRGDALTALRKSMREDGNYGHALMQAFWEGWQARATLADQPSQAQAAEAIPGGWKLDVGTSDARVWLTVTTPHGASASLSCAEKNDSGRTIQGQVLMALKEALDAPPTSPVASNEREAAASDQTELPDGRNIMQLWFECGRDVFVFHDRIKAAYGAQSSRQGAVANKDAVTREQIEAWGKLAGIELFTERGLERLGDFAMFARMDRTAVPSIDKSMVKRLATQHGLIPADGDRMRREALEECASICEEFDGDMTAAVLSARIRALSQQKKEG